MAAIGKHLRSGCVLAVGSTPALLTVKNNYGNINTTIKRQMRTVPQDVCRINLKQGSQMSKTTTPNEAFEEYLEGFSGSYWKERALKAELALSGKTQFDEATAAVSAERERIRAMVEDRRSKYRAYNASAGHFDEELKELDWFLGIISDTTK